jgi:hypothetical protein
MNELDPTSDAGEQKDANGVKVEYDEKKQAWTNASGEIWKDNKWVSVGEQLKDLSSAAYADFMKDALSRAKGGQTQ